MPARLERSSNLLFQPSWTGMVKRKLSSLSLLVGGQENGMILTNIESRTIVDRLTALVEQFHWEPRRTSLRNVQH